jgi:hypothetical protein
MRTLYAEGPVTASGGPTDPRFSRGSGMANLTVRSTSTLAFCLALLGADAGALTIDDFGDGALQIVTGGMTLDFQYTQSSGVIVGGDREETVANSGAGVILAGEVTPDSWTYGASSALGTALLVWDGPGGASPGLDATGLGGADFSVSGTHDAIGISILSNDLVTDITLSVYTNATDFSTIALSTPGSAGNLIAAFADFVVAGGSGADFANVGAFTFEIDGQSAPPLADLDLTFGLIETTVNVGVPEPNTASMVALGLALLAATHHARRKA